MGTMCLAHCPMQRENLEILNGDSWSVVIKAIKFAWTWIMKVPTSYHSFDDLVLGGISFLCEMSFFWGFMHKSNRLCWKGIDSEGKFKLRNKGIKRQKWDLIPKLHFYVYSVLIYSIAKNVLEATKCHSGGNQPVTSGSCRNNQPQTLLWFPGTEWQCYLPPGAREALVCGKKVSRNPTVSPRRA